MPFAWQGGWWWWGGWGWCSGETRHGSSHQPVKLEIPAHHASKCLHFTGASTLCRPHADPFPYQIHIQRQRHHASIQKVFISSGQPYVDHWLLLFFLNASKRWVYYLGHFGQCGPIGQFGQVWAIWQQWCIWSHRQAKSSFANLNGQVCWESESGVEESNWTKAFENTWDIVITAACYFMGWSGGGDITTRHCILLCT